ncbi:unnamed protein product [Gongylonema pulchrum]|uniref:Phosphate transport system regulatory protein PhoU n=1 Tax=Gongylonema pulchrum TaxID=637853 RepID=A0A183EAB7_9BILA|nr:unnamed protein product [Gongylonema pulchrum]
MDIVRNAFMKKSLIEHMQALTVMENTMEEAVA